jgi:hypothetical protein
MPAHCREISVGLKLGKVHRARPAPSREKNARRRALLQIRDVPEADTP